MAFSVSKVDEFEPDVCHAVLKHQAQLLTVILKCSYAEAVALPPEFLAEMDHKSVVKFEAGLPADDSSSGLFATDDAAVILADGTVHNHLEIGPDHVVIDVYVQRGPEFFAVTSEELGGTLPDIGTRLRVWLLGLSVYPTRC
jgi:hypothetical protein